MEDFFFLVMGFCGGVVWEGTGDKGSGGVFIHTTDLGAWILRLFLFGVGFGDKASKCID